MSLYDFTVVSHYSFGHNNNLLEDEARSSTQRNNISRLLLEVKFNSHFPWLFDALDMIPFSIGKHIMPPGALDMIEFSEVSLPATTCFLDLFAAPASR